jgi:tetratricopeptide (TPR) repeat protein
LASFVERKDRKIIPRWRPFRSTAALGELDVTADEPRANREDADFLADKLQDWQNHKTLWHATDLVGASLVLGRGAEAKEAAEFILSEASGATLPAKEVAASIIGPRRELQPPPQFGTSDGKRRVYSFVHDLRLRAPEEPRNSIIWVDLALAYTILGRTEQADRAFKVALALDSTNRFVLRSAARFYIHQGDFERAHSILVRAESTVTDPWLLAAEIAVASAGNRKPLFVKPARQMLASGNNPDQELSELASSLATLEFENGNSGAARKLFRTALIAPTENSVAQAEWASVRLSGLQLDPNQFNIPRLFEAKAWDSFVKGDWRAALQDTTNWLEDQQFSSRPAMLAAFILTEAFEDFQQASELLKASLVANPFDVVLLNDLAYSYASLNRLDEAQSELNRIEQTTLEQSSRTLVLATQGLIYFRRGFPDEGRSLYLQAIEVARKNQNNNYNAIAAINLAREELLAESPSATEALRRAEKESADFPSKDVLMLLDRLKTRHAMKITK